MHVLYTKIDEFAVWELWVCSIRVVWHFQMYKQSVFSSLYCKYMQFLCLQPQWYTYTYIVLLAPLTLVAVEKAISEATSVKQSYSEFKTVFFCESE